MPETLTPEKMAALRAEIQRLNATIIKLTDEIKEAEKRMPKVSFFKLHGGQDCYIKISLSNGINAFSGIMTKEDMRQKFDLTDSELDLAFSSY